MCLTLAWALAGRTTDHAPQTIHQRMVMMLVMTCGAYMCEESSHRLASLWPPKTPGRLGEAFIPISVSVDWPKIVCECVSRSS